MSSYAMRDLGGGTAGGLLAARANQAPDKAALVFGGSETSYRQLDDAASAVASSLLGLGLQPGDAVSVFMSNRPECLIASFAIGRAGLRLVPVNTAYKGAFLDFAIDHSESRAIITESLLGGPLADLEGLPKCVAAVAYVDGRPDRLPFGDVAIHDWDELLTPSVLLTEFPPVGPDYISSIGYTSGTTGRSKGVLSPALQGVMHAAESAVAMGTTSQDRLYTCLPLFHGAAFAGTCLHAIYAGATACLSPRFTASGFWDEIRDTGATQFNALGSIIPMLMAQPASDRDRDHAVRRVFAAPAPPDMLYRFEERYGIHIVEGYGLTEVKNIMYNPLGRRKVGSMGTPTASSIVEIHDEGGRPVPAGQVGEIVYRPRVPDVMFKGYHRDPEATLATMGDLWWHTGDLGATDEDGYFYFVDRKKDALRRRGENISSQEVEATIVSFPGVFDAAAIGARSDLGEQEVLAVLEVADPGSFDIEALFRHCDNALPHFMVPRYFRIAPAMSIARTPTGKIRKVELREEGVTEQTWDADAAGLKPTRNF
ncbi:MAG: AMP-binding protein [Actinomycetota bacterium]|nr:AMP-binding protein [Actinomycetota bacterium]